MVVSIANSEILTVTDPRTKLSTFGGAQEWYASQWQRKAGCGPTCAANLTAYLALTRPELRSLYRGEDCNRDAFLRHMNEVYPFVKPGLAGLNRVERFSEGVVAFAASRGISLTPHVCSVKSNRTPKRPGESELFAFVEAGLRADCPIAFLNLSRGNENKLQSWHWISITSANMEEDRLIACASDEGRLIEFDLLLWYLSTTMRGGLVYFTQ